MQRDALASVQGELKGKSDLSTKSKVTDLACMHSGPQVERQAM